MTIVCFDTNVLIWGIKKEATKGQEEMILRTTMLVEQLKKDNAHIVIPSVVLAEFFMRIPIEEHAENLNLLSQAFQITSVDAYASSLFAKIWQKNKNGGFPHKGDDIREKMKIDYLVVATALSKNAEVIYSNNDHIKKFGTDFIKVCDIPSLPGQLSLL